MWTKEQKQAIDEFGTNILVSAGAGSGKTAVLTSRIIQHLEKMNVDELLVLTFTEAAAAEMKERIRNKILENNLTHQLALLDQAYITTFDSFNLSIVKKYHYLVNVKRNISIADASMMILYKEQLMDDLFETLYEERNSDFVDFMNLFTHKNDYKIKEYILKFDSNLDLKANKEEFLSNYINLFFNKDYQENVTKEFIEILNEEFKTIYHLANEFLGYGYEKMNPEINKITMLYEDEPDYNKLFEFFNSFSFPRTTKGALDEAKECYALLKDKFSKLKNKLIYSSNLEFDECFNQNKKYVSVLIDIITKFNTKVANFKFERDLYEFNDIAKLALRLVNEFDVVSNEMKGQFKEILVDEYQDTSDLQEQFINAISTNNIYAVGDIKQSIYRFRNANPYNFQNKYLDYKDLKGGIKIDLLKNFRSRKEVLDNINLLFEDLMSIKHGAANYREGHEMIAGNTNYDSSSNDFYNMEFLTYNKDDFKSDEYEAFIIGNKIKEYINNKKPILNKENKLQDCSYNDFAILLDRSSSFELYRNVFNYLQIPVSVFKEEVLTSSVILKVISNLLNLIVNYNNRQDEYKFSYASISRSFISDNTDNDLLVELMNNCADTEISNLIKEIGYKINDISPLSIYYLLIERFDIYNRIIKLDSIRNSLYHLEYLHDIIDNLSKSGYDIYAINTYFKDILSNEYDLKVSGATNPNGVKIMTIHKSKGLEFPYIFMAGLAKKFNTLELNDAINYDKKYGIITPFFSDGLKDNFIKTCIKRNYLLEEISEKIRLFYVALTRAREKMFFVCETFENDKEKEISEMNNFKDFLYFNFDKIEKFIKVDQPQNISEDYKITIEKSFKKLINKNNKKITENNYDSNLITKHKISKELDKVIDDNLRKNIELGLRLHQILETIDFNNVQLEKLNLSDFELEVVQGILKLEIFNEKNSTYYQELEFIYEKDKESFHGIIDLFVERENDVLIVDYKLKNTSSKEYVEQLKQYEEYIKTITNKPIKKYLLSILDKKLTVVK